MECMHFVKASDRSTTCTLHLGRARVFAYIGLDSSSHVCTRRAIFASVADRECDPDLCKPCQWTICSHKPPGSTDCQNMALRMRQHKRVAMGLSHVAGWGAFAQVRLCLIAGAVGMTGTGGGRKGRGAQGG